MITVNDLRTDKPIVYDFAKAASVKVMERVISLLNEEMLVEMLNIDHPLTVDVYLSASDIPAPILETHRDPSFNFFAEYALFISNREHVAICIDRITGTLSLAEVKSEEQETD
jgi:hypothetical protein